jgi:hypothetical protein
MCSRNLRLAAVEERRNDFDDGLVSTIYVTLDLNNLACACVRDGGDASLASPQSGDFLPETVLNLYCNAKWHVATLVHRAVNPQ